MANDYLDGMIVNGDEYDFRDSDAQERIADLKSAIDVETKPHIIQVQYNEGRFGGSGDIGDTYTPNYTSQSGWVCSCMPIKKGDIINVYGTSTENTRLYIVTDLEYKITAIRVGEYNSQTPIKVIASADGYAFFNALLGSAHGCTIHSCGYESYLVDKESIEFENGIYSGTPSLGQTFNPDKTSNDSWKCAKVPVKAFDHAVIKGSGSQNTRMWVLTDSSNKVVAYQTPQVYLDVETDTVYVPTSGFLYVNVIASSFEYATIYSSTSDNNLLKEYVTNKELEKTCKGDFVPVTYETGLYSSTGKAIGDSYNPSVTDNTAWECVKIPVYRGDVISVFGQSSENAKIFVACSKNNVVTQMYSNAYQSETPLSFTISEDGYVYVNSVKSYPHGLSIKTYRAENIVEHNLKCYTDKEIEEAKEINTVELNFDYNTTRIPQQNDDSAYPATAEGIYDLYDSLVEEYTDYIEKIDTAEAESVLGITKPSYLEGMKIYMYKFIPKLTRRYDSLGKRLKMMVLTGVHPDEKMGIFNLFKLMKYICENWKTDVNAELFRTRVEFYIIPCLSPWGYEHNSRINGNGVNLNRNNPTKDWVAGSAGPNYGGLSAGSEYETKIWNYYFGQIQPTLFLDQHTPQMNEWGEMGVVVCDQTKDYIANVAKNMCRSISNQLIIEDSAFPDNPQTTLYDIHPLTAAGTGETPTYAMENGTKYAALFEIAESNKWHNGELTETIYRNKYSGIQIRECMQNIYVGWMRWMFAAATDDNVN